MVRDMNAKVDDECVIDVVGKGGIPGKNENGMADRCLC